MKTKLLKLLVLCLLLFGFAEQVKAWHLVGGEISYQCLGNNQYLITMKIYRDCNQQNGAQFDDPAELGIFNSAGTLVQSVFMYSPQITVIPPYLNNPCVQPPPVCVEEGIYTDIVTLPPIPGGYNLVYQRCCRNATIVNLTQPGNQGATHTTHIPGPPYACNNSAVFQNFPPIALCVLDTLVFDHSVIDPDGDSIYYQFTNPYLGASQIAPQNPPQPPPFSSVNWAAGFNAGYAITSSPAFTINPNTGLITGVPTQVGQYVMCISAFEYRNGVLLTENRREFQFNCTPCIVNTVASVQNQTIFCNSLTVDFTNLSTIASFFIWDFGDPTTNADTSTLANPTYTYSDTGTYVVTLIANPGWPCTDTTTAIIEVYLPITPSFTVNDPVQCINTNNFIFTSTGAHSPQADYTWSFGNGQVSNVENPSVTYSAPGTYYVQLDVEDMRCLTTTYDTVVVAPLPELILGTAPVEGCAPLTVQFDNLSSAFGNETYLWQFSDGSSSTQFEPNMVFPNPGVYSLQLTMFAPDGCPDTLTQIFDDFITVKPSPTANFTASPLVTDLYNPNITIQDYTDPNLDVYFVMGDGDTIFNRLFTHRYLYDGNYSILQIVTNAEGCQDSMRVDIVINPAYLVYVPNAFTPNNDGVNDIFLPSVRGDIMYEFYIFDRWGKTMFYTTNSREGWDGTEGGKDAPMALYTYVIKLRSFDGKFERYEGTLSLIR